MTDKLIELLETFGYEVHLQGTLLKDEPYPANFFTFWNNGTEDGNHYDNDAVSYIWNFTVYFYSTNPDLTYTVLENVRTLLKQNNWIVSGKGYDVPTDEQTHTGRAIDALFLEFNKGEN